GSENKDHPTYLKWKERVEFLKSPIGGYLAPLEAIVYASKEFPCLYPLFREFDVSQYDKTPSYRQDVQKFGESAKCIDGGKLKDIENQNLDWSYRENLSWAMEAAGKYMRTNCAPASCPNNSAWFLYRQAIENPKDFMMRIGQIENKSETPEDRIYKKIQKKSIAELDAMLEELEEISQEEIERNNEKNISEENEEREEEEEEN
ncbi:MAG: hypothetical protein ABH983_04805, partial [Candidatus Micrarchaeota archaeon]